MGMFLWDKAYQAKQIMEQRPKLYGQTYKKTDRRTDNVKTIHPSKHSLRGMREGGAGMDCRARENGKGVDAITTGPLCSYASQSTNLMHVTNVSGN